MNFWNDRLCRFLLVGGTATLLQMLLLVFLVEMELMNPVMASATSYVISAFYNYIANFYFTFSARENKRHTETAPKFVVVSVIGVATNTLAFATANHFLNFYAASQVVAVFVTLLVNYLLHKFWIYRS